MLDVVGVHDFTVLRIYTVVQYVCIRRLFTLLQVELEVLDVREADFLQLAGAAVVLAHLLARRLRRRGDKVTFQPPRPAPARRTALITVPTAPTAAGGICPASSRSMAARTRRSVWSRCR
ncbi:hypothetical protein [Streptomyces sp. NRRL WC-3744]|uniref:hypothetical protein n=1 Tax=Streptomyces sp. NRRL WC-3744 TaxID=1463935 RepID=UPI00131D8743|nr:hypothetical protein [Streptomyces sp. NRRL WC-3744]